MWGRGRERDNEGGRKVIPKRCYSDQDYTLDWFREFQVDQFKMCLVLEPSLYASIFLYSATILIFVVSSLTLGISLVFHLLNIRDLVANMMCIAIDLTEIGYSDMLILRIAFSIEGLVKTPEVYGDEDTPTPYGPASPLVRSLSNKDWSCRRRIWKLCMG